MMCQPCQIASNELVCFSCGANTTPGMIWVLDGQTANGELLERRAR